MFVFNYFANSFVNRNTSNIAVYLQKNYKLKLTGKIIKRIRKDKGLMQKEVSAYLVMGNSNYNKLENGHRDL